MSGTESLPTTTSFSSPTYSSATSFSSPTFFLNQRLKNEGHNSTYWLTFDQYRMNARPNHRKWEEVNVVSKNVSICVGVKFNNEKFIFQASPGTPWQGLYLYCIDGGGLEKFIEYPKKVKTDAESLDMNSSKTKLYGFLNGDEPEFVVDLKTLRFEWKPFRLQGGYLCNGNGILDVIERWNDKERDSFRQAYRDGAECATKVSFFNVTSKDIIVMIIGGWHSNTISVYCVNTKKWIKKVQFPIQVDAHLRCALTSDEKYIIMSHCCERCIYVLNISEFEIYKSFFPPPLYYEEHWIALTRTILRDEKVAYGWIRLNYDVSMDVCKFIAKWYCREELHWIGMLSRRHFTVDVDYVSSSLEKEKFATVNHWN